MNTSRLAALVIAPLAIACTNAPEGVDNDSMSFMRGDMGHIQRIDDTLHRSYSEYYEGYAYIEMHVLGEYGWAMLGVSVWGGELGFGDLAPGNEVYLRSTSIDSDGNGDSVGGDVVGCSGPGEWDFSFDEGAEEVLLTIDEVPDTGDLIVGVEADFGDGGSVEGRTVVGSGTRMY